MYWTLALGLVVVSLLDAAHSQIDVHLTTLKGPIVGTRITNSAATGASYDAFLGIPYGSVNARFQVAVPPLNWTTELSTKADGPACPQPNMTFSENCLFMNVFTPPNAMSSSTKVPVMAYVHGSGFTWSSSSSTIYGPDFLVPQGVILVTFNYRLGAAGFLTLGSKIAPGNLGLTDTLLALQWVKDEISAFGGNPANVTLFGQSAGGAVVVSHYISSLSTGLFSNAIAQSGSALADWAVIPMEEGVRRSKQLAQQLGCNMTADNATILACLQNANIQDVVDNQSITLPSEDMISGTCGLRFVPVLDSYLTADMSFFNDTLANLMTKAATRAIPLIIGVTLHDGTVKFALDDTWMQAQNNLADFIPRRFRNGVKNGQRSLMQQNIENQYFPDTFDENKVFDLIRLYTDTMFGYPAVEVSRFFGNFTYSYVFSYYGSWSPPSRILQTSYRLQTVGHGAEVPYLFYLAGVSLPLDSCTLNAANIKMKDQMVKWWTTFAKTGSPDPLWWKVYDGGYLLIDSATTMMNVSSFENQYYNFWANMEKSSSSIPSINVLYVIVFILVNKYL